jgi:hypothetical protein
MKFQYIRKSYNTNIMHAIDWDYDSMRAWYLKHAKYVDETKNVPVFGFLYEAKKPSYRNSTKVEPFVNTAMKWSNLAPVQNKELFPNNLYTLIDAGESKKRWLFFVYPLVKQCTDAEQKELFADHFSFCIDKSDQKKPCHFHSTTYDCIRVAGDTKHKVAHTNDFMPDKLKLPANEGNIFKQHVAAKGTLLDLIKYPWVYDRGPYQQTGGAKNNNRVASRPITDAPFHRSFCNKWSLWGIKRLYAIGVRKGNLVHWNVSVFKGRLKMNHMYQSLHYTTPVNTAMFEQELWRHFSEEFEPWWE